MRMRSAIALVASSVGVVGCGNEAPTFTGSDEQQVAATVRTVTDAMADGDGDLACSLISDPGRDALVKVFREGMPEAGVGSCEEGVEAIGEKGYDTGGVLRTARDVEVYYEDTPDTAQMPCRPRGAFILQRTDEGWRVGAPFCVD